MRLAIGGAIRPLNECVASISYKPIYDVSRIVTAMVERWDISGRIILNPTASQRLMTAALVQLANDFSQEGVDLAFLEDLTNVRTALVLSAADCIQGPYIVDSGIPNQAGDNYATGLAYRVIYEGKRLAGRGSTLLEFDEQVTEDPGGQERVYVGGTVNYAERQIGSQAKTYRYKQSGSAVGLFAYPTPPPAIWPWALVRDEPRVSYASPRVLGYPDQEFKITWEYEFEWHIKLYGRPHRRV